MPSLRKRVSTYLRQLSFHNEPRDKKNNVNENAFVTKYLQGYIVLREGPPIIYGKNPTDLPNYELGRYDSGPSTIISCYSGPNGGLTTVKRTEKHLSVPDDDIDFIDNPEEEPIPSPLPKKSPNRLSGQPIDNTTMIIKVAGNEYCVTNKPKRHSKSYSLGSISDFNIEVEKTKIDRDFYNCDSKQDENSNNKHTKCQKNLHTCDSQAEKREDVVKGESRQEASNTNTNNTKTTKTEPKEEVVLRKRSHQESRGSTNPNSNMPKPSAQNRSHKPTNKADPHKNRVPGNYSLAKSKSDGNPFQHKKKGKIIQVQRLHSHKGNDSTENLDTIPSSEDMVLPSEWNRKSDCCYGISDSLYDRNQVTRHKNGDPIADCFGVISRNDSAILAVADGVNWGEKASIAAKSAVHAALHYLNKTIFNDTKPFEKLTTKTEDVTADTLNPDHSANLVSNTREVFVCLLRAFNCAHDLILENNGMLTTLTVAVVLPLKHKASQRLENGVRSTSQEPHYVCCVCNVGDTLAYVYSQRNGIRELTKGSHDVNSNRDMRDALGALGPVDGMNPELSNLTLSITTLNKGDIVIVASDGLTDNFDPNVCKFTVNSNVDASKSKPKKATTEAAPSHLAHPIIPEPKPQTSHSQKPEETSISAQKPPIKPPRRSKNRASISSASQSERSNSSAEKDIKAGDVQRQSSSNEQADMNHPLKEHFMRENSLEEPRSSKGDVKLKNSSVIENRASHLRKQVSNQSRLDATRKLTPPSRAPNLKTLDTARGKSETVGYKFLKSKTALDLRPPSHHQPKIHILRNDDGIPYVTPIQRYELQLLLMEDILKNGISGKESSITSAKKLCESLVSFTLSITSAKRRTLEDPDMYFDNRNGLLVEVSNQEKKNRRKKGLEKVQSLPGKLDHVTVIAYNVGNVVL